MPMIRPVGRSTRTRTSPISMSQAVNHHSPAFTMSATSRNDPVATPPCTLLWMPPRSASEPSIASSQIEPAPIRGWAGSGTSPHADVDAPQGSRERAREEDRQDEAEHAGRLPDVVRRRERLPHDRERIAPHPQPRLQGGDDRQPDARGHEGGDHDDEREERHEGLRRQGDAAVDELDLEHAFPDAPQERCVQPGPQGCGATAARRRPRRGRSLRVVGHAPSPRAVARFPS